jgi:sodium transport system permease protein|tara:strand:- start:167 stop:1360 length:1194 start_codon:yes stop_codon:yes gene_type:complete
MNIIFSIFKKELTDVLRDRRTLFFMIVIPVIVMPLILIGSIKFQEYQSKKSDEKVLNIGLINKTSDSQIRDYLLDQKGVYLVEDIDLDSLELGIKNDSLQGGLYIHKNFINDISANGMGEVEVYYKSSDLMSKAKNRIYNALDIYKNEVVSERLSEFNVDKGLLEPLDIINKDMSTKKETIGKAVGGLIPYMLVIFIFLGAMYPAIDLGAGEKERGSLETLLSSPATKFEITVGKLMVVSLAGMVSGLISVVGISAPIYLLGNIPDQIKSTVLEIISPFIIVSVIILMIPIAIFFASMLLSISFYARSFKEAQSLMGPLNIVIIVPLMLTLGPGIEIDHITALIPLINVGLLTKEILAGSAQPIYFIETLSSLLFFAAIGIRFSVYWFNKENTIFRV